ncbi:MAG: CYTH domain-containing protein [Chloroflexota bacterium]
MNESENTYEVELKLQPRDEALLDRIWLLDRLGPYTVMSRQRHRHHNLYFDSPEHALDQAGGNLRWRVITGAQEAELTYKGPSQVRNGVFQRLEVTAVLPSSVDPLTVEPPPHPLQLARMITQDLAPTELVLETDRRGLRLQSPLALVELDLDITTMPTTDYCDIEIEGELIHGDPSVLAELEELLSQLGPVKRASKGKRARGWAFWRNASRDVSRHTAH